MTRRGVAKVLAEASGPLLLDFDGPLCAVFAGVSARAIAAELRELLMARGAVIPDELKSEDDPLEVLRWTGAQHQRELTRSAEEALRAAELRAIGNAEPTPHTREVIAAAKKAGRKVAIVSNNSEPAITAYLKTEHLAAHIDAVVGRAYADPGRMKPNPSSVLSAISTLHATPNSCVLVGDSTADVMAARSAGIRIIGYANKPGKTAQLARADAIVADMIEIADALPPHSGRGRGETSSGCTCRD